eukprot:m51a1_g11458 putative mono- or diacylglycerol acyltransferase (768) ;mRNA; r:1297-4143
MKVYGHQLDAPPPSVLKSMTALVTMSAFALLLLSVPVAFVLSPVFLITGRFLAFAVVTVPLVVLSIWPRKLRQNHAVVSCPVWSLWREYFQFGLLTEFDRPLDPDRRYIFAEVPHGVFPVGLLLASSLIFNHDLMPVFGTRPAVAAVADVVLALPVWRQVFGMLGVVSASRKSLERVSKTHNICIVPGGVAEMAITSHDAERVYLKKRKGFVKFALRHGFDLVPCFHFGNSQIIHMHESRLLQWLSRKLRFSLLLFWGRWGLPIPYPAHILEVVAPPIHVERVEEPTEQQINELHDRFVKELIALFERHKHRVGWTDRTLEPAGQDSPAERARFVLPFGSADWWAATEAALLPLGSCADASAGWSGPGSRVHDDDESAASDRELLPTLRQAIAEHYDEGHGGISRFYAEILPRISAWALGSRTLFGDTSLPAMPSGSPALVRLTRFQARSLLSHAFFCNLPHHAATPSWTDVSMHELYWIGGPVAVSRIRCLLAYFEVAACWHDDPGGVTFERRSAPAASRAPESLRGRPLCTRVEFADRGGVEDAPADYEAVVDFANKDLHAGGVVTASATQEDVLFSVHPELFLCMLATQTLLPDEAVVMRGARRVCRYVGYGPTWRYDGLVDEALCETPGPLSRPVVAIDAAEMYAGSPAQYSRLGVWRDVLKAQAGFAGLASVSTGNWGCGVFRGDPALKMLQQVVAASAAGVQRMWYTTFGNAEQRVELEALLCCVQQSGADLLEVFEILCSSWGHGTQSLTEHVMQILKTK